MTSTAPDGSYAFTALRPGTYTVTETEPAGLLNGRGDGDSGDDDAKCHQYGGAQGRTGSDGL